MASHVVVNGSNGSKAQIKTTPAMTLRTVLTQACQKMGVENEDQYGLKLGRTMMDLSLSMRFANLAQGAKLELVHIGKSNAAPSKVTIALQMEDGARLKESFASTVVLWQILEHFERQSNGTLNITRRTANPQEKSQNVFKKFAANFTEPVYLIPAMLILDKEVSTVADLKTKRLMDVGVTSGNTLIRLMYKFSGKTLAEMQAELDQPVSAPATPPSAPRTASASTSAPSASSSVPQKSDPAPASVAPNAAPSVLVSAPASSSPDPASSISAPATSPVPAPVRSQTPQPVDDANDTLDRQVRLFNPPMDSTLSNKIDLPESFFQLSSTELKAIVASQRNRRAADENAPLRTSAMRARDEEERRRKQPKTLIRVRFPDRFQLQLVFYSHEKLQHVHDAIQSQLHPNYTARAFFLYTTPPIHRLSDLAQTLWDAKLTPASVVHFAFHAAAAGEEDGDVPPTPALLHPDVLMKAEDLAPPSAMQTDAVAPMDLDYSAPVPKETADGEDDHDRERRRAELAAQAATATSSRPTTASSVVPKWLKLSKK
ncbi:hypothetical protein RI367_006321 [Sorochytrium milnesiophthora]